MFTPRLKTKLDLFLKRIQPILIGSLGLFLILPYLIAEFIEEGNFQDFYNHLFGGEFFLHHLMLIMVIPSFITVAVFYSKKQNLAEHLEEIMQVRTKDLEATKEKLIITSRITSHDVRNKLALITGATYILKKKEENNAIVKNYLDNIASTVHSIVRILDTSNAYVTLGTESLHYCDLEEYFEVAKGSFSDSELEGVNLRTGCSGVQVLCDSLIKVVFYNLIHNSLHHGKRVTEINLNCEKQSSHLLLVYMDNGIGIPMGEKIKIFQEGFGKGTGLGLFLIQKIISSYGWNISEVGKADEGVQFVISIPENSVKKETSFKVVKEE